MELKVTTETLVRAPWAFERKRLVPWWCQSIISGTPLIVYGIRDYDGHVTSIEHARTDDIPDRVGRENLDPEKYLMLLSDILTWIKGIVCVEDATSVYSFQWDPDAPGRGVTANALLRDAGNTFLPEWYVREMEDYFPLAGEQRQRKGVKRAMEDEKQGKDQEIKLKGIRKRMEESWPRRKSSCEPDVHIEKPPARGLARSRSPGYHSASDLGRTTSEIRVSVDEELYSTREPFGSEGYKREHQRSKSPGFQNASDRVRTTSEIRASADEERCSARESFESEKYKRKHQRSRSPGFHNGSDRGRTTSEIHLSVDEEFYSTREPFGSEGYKRKHQRSKSAGFHNASDRGRTTSEIRVSVDEEFYSTREPFGSEGYKREHLRSKSSGFHNASGRGRERTTSEIRVSVDEEFHSTTEPFGSEGYKREHLRLSSTREQNEKRPLRYEDQFDLDRTSTRVYEERSEPYPNRRSRDKIGKARRYERRRREDQVQQQARAWSRKAFNESRSQRSSGREYPSSTDDRIPTKRVKPDAEYENRGMRHQDSTRYNYPHRN